MNPSISATVAKFLLGLFNAAVSYHLLSQRTRDTGYLFLGASIIFFLGFLWDLLLLLLHRNKKQEHEEAAKAPESKPPRVAASSGESYATALQNLKIGKPCRVDGVSQYISNILELAQPNPDYDMGENEIIDNRMVDERIWKYSFKPQKATLSRQKDSNTINVMINGKPVGYIGALPSSRILEMKKEDIEVLYCSIGGGPYKIMYEEEMTGRHQVYEREKSYSVTLSIYEN